MLADILASALECNTVSSDIAPKHVSPEPEFVCLEAGACLYQEGNLRTHVYRVEQGLIAVYEKRIGRPNHTIDIAGRGDFVGLACFEQYIDSAFAIESSLLTRLDEREFVALAERDLPLQEQHKNATHRHFQRHKEAILDQYPSTSVQALASFLISLSRQNVHEGRNPSIIMDSFRCGVIARLLGFDIDTLGKALSNLESEALIQEASNGQLHLLDLERLERLADGAVTLSQIEL